MGVNTAMTADDNLALRVVAAAAEMLEPEDVATAVVEGLRDGRFLILPHPEVLTFVAARPRTTTAGWPACSPPTGPRELDLGVR